MLFSPAGPLFVQRPLFIPQQSAGYGYQMEKYVDDIGHHRSQLLCIDPYWEATGSPGSVTPVIAWGGDRLTPLAAGRDRFARHNGRHTRIVGAKTRGCVSCFHKLICFGTALIVNASLLAMVSMLVVH